ncbi:helix-turn-helix domain-containing protein [Streptomyces prunicolor]|uniref:Helix-turn-helix domain-containing protein n=1 Tax=Streptomyces prunicolor TaxID=67348 RepID=A0ABU4F887_9ACTN|nr:helix-turn-helix domain-containing protein [Streptomyces prunicolor]MDV7216806.1 helix-turn-helix domain-containing protein [Streptomyces prunicolor]
MDPGDLGEFVRVRRTTLCPSDVGLTGGPRRRVPGLRRDEVARLAGLSPGYYARIEQGGEPRPSARALTGVACALRLSRDEYDLMFRLAGRTSPAAGHVEPALLTLLDRLTDIPALITTGAHEVLVRNAPARALLGHSATTPLAAHTGAGALHRVRFVHPALGLLELDSGSLLTPDGAQRLLWFTARPGSPAADRLRLLSVIGLQEFRSEVSGAAEPGV